MVDRDLVEDLLSDATHPDADYERVEASTLAALCRAWLAVEDAPKVRVRGKVGEVCMVPVSHDFCGQRVRIVKEGG